MLHKKLQAILAPTLNILSYLNTCVARYSRVQLGYIIWLRLYDIFGRTCIFPYFTF